MDSIDVRCSAIVFRDDAVLLVHRSRNGTDDWVLPGGTPRTGESMAACARRETLEETGLSVDPARVAFVLEAWDLRPRGAPSISSSLPRRTGAANLSPASQVWKPGSSRSACCPSWMSARRWPGTCAPCMLATASPRPPTWAISGARSTGTANANAGRAWPRPRDRPVQEICPGSGR